ncbi:ATP-dependent Clp protease adaptor protein ClpS [Lentzea atacamensis]|uniref:ATP-dependent Clp protease adaptor protein ClpS n=1 Tax=Lentzea atacamensis TaxID=531938 RepID=A0A316HNX5_9PSEU|nr:ATP-dependent Clp protease adaptor protein ClpS [Lentzea atacamensis]
MAFAHTLPVSSGDRWQVVLHNDDVNVFCVVQHLLRKACRHDAEQAQRQTLAIHESGSAVVGTYDRKTAEEVTFRLMRSGLHATFGRAR